jgi:KDO2-lipid IV(A) lauroyltransferase
MRAIKNRLEYALASILLLALRSLPLDAASYIGGFIARSVGPLTRGQRTARANLAHFLPDIPWKERRKLLLDMWDNLGRTAAELSHIGSERLYNRIELVNGENLPQGGKQVLFFSGHVGNWELLSPIVFKHNIPTMLVYRKANNPLVDALINRQRARQAHGMLPKGPSGAVKLVRSIKSGDSIAMLIDQKMNDGISVPFFGVPAMTAPAIAEFALRYKIPIVPARVVRTKGCHFKGIIYPPLDYTPTGDQQADVLAIMTRINAIIEGWVREYPEQWFWVHRRWPKGTVSE